MESAKLERELWAAKEGVSEEKAREAMRLASHKLPVKCKFAIKEEKSKGGEAYWN